MLIGLKQNRDCKFCRLVDKNPEHLASNCIAITEIRADHLGKDITDKKGIHSLNPTQLLQFIEALDR